MTITLPETRSQERDGEFYYLSFRMRDEFFEGYRNRQPKWGFPIGAGNTLGEHSWVTKYARRKADGGRERFWEGLRRVIEGTYSIQKDHAMRNRLPWNEEMAHRSAQEAYTRAFDGKWSAPGRGLWAMGTEMVNKRGDSSPLFNCAFLSTEDLSDMSDPSFPFTRLMSMSLHGCGVGFDTRGAGKVTIHEPSGRFHHSVADSREGWCESLGSLLRAFFLGSKMPIFDYSRVRPAGAPIKTFGGTAAGPAPLKKLHDQVTTLLSGRQGQVITSRDIVDIMNLAGKCVVAGNVRRSAEIALGSLDDEDFLDLKNWEINPERNGPDGWGHLSNNCCRRDTEIVTRDGIAAIGDLAGTTVELRDGNGKWINAPVKSYGTAELFKITWRSHNGKSRKVIYATANHRWFVTPTKHKPLEEVFTKDLVPGHLTYKSTRVRFVPNIMSRTGVQAGFIFGDGTSWDTGAKANFCGDKDKSLLPFFEGHNIHTDARDVSYTSFSFPRSWKELPSLREGASYLYGWLAGYFAADGCVTGDGAAIMSSAEKENIEAVRSIATILGIDTFPIRVTTRPSSYTGKPHTMYAVTLSMRDMPEEFFLIPEHRNRVPKKKTHRSSVRWIVASVEPTGISEEVFCAEVPTTQSFMLADGLLTGNSVIAHSGDDLSHIAKRVEIAGEPGVFWLDIAQNYGRLIDPPDGKDYRVRGLNPCGEISLEGNGELCCLVETFPNNCTDMQDYLRTLKFSYLFAKTTNLLMTCWPETNEIMIRNRRIGTSMTGVAQFAEKNGWAELRRWQDAGYQEIRKWDQMYSAWLGVRESIRVTTVKPSGTVALLWGATPGVHWPRERGYYVRTVREMKDSPLAKVMADAGYPVEPSFSDPDTTVVITMPVEGPDIRPEREVSIWEKTALAAQCQRVWSDNSVSVTVGFSEAEAKEIPAVLRAYDGQLKSISFLPMAEGTYQQAPYQKVSREEWDSLRAQIKPVDWDALYETEDMPEATGELYCSNDSCEIPSR